MLQRGRRCEHPGRLCHQGSQQSFPGPALGARCALGQCPCPGSSWLFSLLPELLSCNGAGPGAACLASPRLASRPSAGAGPEPLQHLGDPRCGERRGTKRAWWLRPPLIHRPGGARGYSACAFSELIHFASFMTYNKYSGAGKRTCHVWPAPPFILFGWLFVKLTLRSAGPVPATPAPLKHPGTALQPQ